MQQTNSGPSFEEIKQLWEETREPIYTISLVNPEVLKADGEAVSFLREVGFPEAAEPGLDFTDLTEKLFTHSQLYTRDDFPALDEYLVIGSTGEGNPICIDVSDGSIVCIDHDNGFESIFLNSSLSQFSYCLACYGNAVREKNALTISYIERLRERMRLADTRALGEHTYWDNELNLLERELG